ncbi:hypothetical protein M0802_010511 [Mischocyttarus mexicanus]|nr:hypothetical protein M0802_010511 [Mischocyttarus mexicanus]
MWTALLTALMPVTSARNCGGDGDGEPYNKPVPRYCEGVCVTMRYSNTWLKEKSGFSSPFYSSRKEAATAPEQEESLINKKKGKLLTTAPAPPPPAPPPPAPPPTAEATATSSALLFLWF